MKSIGFIQIFSKRYGGVVYRKEVMRALENNFEVDIINLEEKSRAGKYSAALKSFFKLFRLKEKKDLWIRDFYSTTMSRPQKTQGKNIALIFHIDFSGFPFLARILFSFLEKMFFYRCLKKMDAIVTISEYWKEYFQKMGYLNVHKIYCGFDLDLFKITAAQTSAFKRKYGLTDKPIVYIGNCQKAKGVVETYQTLKDLDVQLVSSGHREVVLPARHLDLDYKEYLMLLKSADLAVLMSKFKEGWCMTAHEAMISGTPVVGSGAGGMGELLKGGGQIVTDFNNLKKEVMGMLENPSRRRAVARSGSAFAKKFTQKRFQGEWIKFVQSILK